MAYDPKTEIPDPLYLVAINPKFDTKGQYKWKGEFLATYDPETNKEALLFFSDESLAEPHIEADRQIICFDRVTSADFAETLKTRYSRVLIDPRFDEAARAAAIPIDVFISWQRSYGGPR